MTRVALVIAMLASTSLASAQDAPDHVLPIRFARRPLTMPQGTFRIDNALVYRPFVQLEAPNQLSVGLTDDIEIGVAWPYTRDPTFIATARFAHSEVIDTGISVAVTTPAITNGDTNLAVSIPMVLRLGGTIRILTGVTAEFLLTQTMQPLLRVPFQLLGSVNDRHYFGLQGSLALADRRFWHGEVGFVFGHTAAATPIRPIGEIRLGTSFLAPAFGVMITLAFSFFPTVLPTPSPETRRPALE